MDRRTLLKGLAIMPFLPARSSSQSVQAQSVAAVGNRRVRVGDASWPTAEDWKQLQEQASGRLISVHSPLAACQSGSDTIACKQTLTNLQNPFYVGDQPGTTQTVGWVDGWTSTPSVYAVAARSTSDVIAAVNFARHQRLRLVVKGGGHSYQGTSNAPDSLLIWTRAMNQVALHDEFVAQGCAGKQKPQPAVTLEAGAMWIDAYHTVTAVGNRYVQGGGCASVGVAGLIQSGGFGSFSKKYGTAAASLLQAEVVTADGEARIVSACSYPDLFWALKGGGGGSFGVVTKITLKTHTLPNFFGRVTGTIQASSDAAFRRLIGKFVSFYAEQLLNPHWGESVAFRSENSFALNMVFQDLDETQARAVWQPFLDWVGKFPEDFRLTAAPQIHALPARFYWDAEYRKKHLPETIVVDGRTDASPYHVWWASNQIEVGVYIHGYESTWLPASLLKDEHQKLLSDALFSASRHWEIALHFNKGLAGAPEDAIAAARNTAMNPAVLEAFALVIIAGGDQHAYPGIPGHEPDLARAHRQAAAIGKAMGELRKTLPVAGAYVSEGNFFDRSWRDSFWGSNYPRLHAVKEKYDPEGLFIVHHGVGSENWSDDAFTRLT